MSIATTMQDVLQQLGAPSAAAVTLTPIPAATGSDAAAVAASAARRAKAISRGECVASRKGISIGVSGTAASALVAAGAKDKR